MKGNFVAQNVQILKTLEHKFDEKDPNSQRWYQVIFLMPVTFETNTVTLDKNLYGKIQPGDTADLTVTLSEDATTTRNGGAYIQTKAKVTGAEIVHAAGGKSAKAS